MSLFGKASIFYNNLINKKMSILSAYRTELIIIFALFILIITPVIINMVSKVEAAAKQVNLYISARSEELLGKTMMDLLLQEFLEKNPDIRLRIVNESAPSAEQADILFFDDNDFSQLIADDSLLELNDFTNYDSGSRQMAVPLVSFMDMLFYNIEILSAAGFASPPKTREQFLAYAKAVSSGDFNASGAAISLNPLDKKALSRDIFSWIWAGGQTFWAEEDKPSLNTRAITNDITFFGSLIREGVLAPDIFETTGDQRIEQFAKGQIALMIASTRIIPYLRERMGDDSFGVTIIPDAGTASRYSIGISSIYAGISAGSKQTGEAWKFIEFLAEKSQFLCAELKAVPGVVSNIIPGDYVKSDLYYSKAWDIFESALIAETFSGRPGANQYKAIFLEELQTYLQTARSALETVNAIQERWNTWDAPDPGETSD